MFVWFQIWAININIKFKIYNLHSSTFLENKVILNKYQYNWSLNIVTESSFQQSKSSCVKTISAGEKGSLISVATLCCMQITETSVYPYFRCLGHFQLWTLLLGKTSLERRNDFVSLINTTLIKWTLQTSQERWSWQFLPTFWGKLVIKRYGKI